MKLKTIAAAFFVLTVLSCSKNDALNNTVSSSADGVPSFQELIALINVQNSDGDYIVVNAIDSVKLYINNNFWSADPTETLNTENLSQSPSGNFNVTQNELSYLLTSGQQDIPDFTQAGDFAEFLNGQFQLNPGEYACFLESFQLTQIDGSVRTFYPYQYKIFSASDQSTSAYIGEFNIQIED